VSALQLGWRVFLGAVIAWLILGYASAWTGIKLFSPDPLGEEVAYRVAQIIFRRVAVAPSESERFVYSLVLMLFFGVQATAIALVGRGLWRLLSKRR
jgi:hypothetical protein